MDSVWGGEQCRLRMCQEEAEARRPPVLILVQMVCDEGGLEEELDRVGGAQHLYRVLKPASLSPI